MVRIDIKPLSVNDCWKGQRFKTDDYRVYENAVGFMLPKIYLPAAPYEIHFRFGFSSKASDWDNPCKPLQDILQKKYGFNDKEIMKAVVEKVKVEKGKEFFEFEILSYENGSSTAR